MSTPILTQKEGKLFRITFNKPARKNAISGDMYDLLCDGLEMAQNDPEVIFTVFTGNGDFYSSGNDFSPNALTAILNKPNAELEKRDGFRHFIELLIKHDKLLIALVNGPAIGIACTTLALFDLVLASDKAYFHCPFTQVGLCAEGASSYTFPALVGHQKAALIAIFAEKFTAREAERCGFVARVFPDAVFHRQAEKLLVTYQKLAPQSVLVTKKLLRPDSLRKEQLDVIQREFDALRDRWMSEETMEFMSRWFLRSKSSVLVRLVRAKLVPKYALEAEGFRTFILFFSGSLSFFEYLAHTVIAIDRYVNIIHSASRVQVAGTTSVCVVIGTCFISFALELRTLVAYRALVSQRRIQLSDDYKLL
ncbi:Enoyl-CoA Hydratase family member-like protein, partial [Aphelenchoides avenae]